MVKYLHVLLFMARRKKSAGPWDFTVHFLPGWLFISSELVYRCVPNGAFSGVTSNTFVNIIDKYDEISNLR